MMVLAYFGIEFGTSKVSIISGTGAAISAPVVLGRCNGR
jgi:hypothetical protein